MKKKKRTKEERILEKDTLNYGGERRNNGRILTKRKKEYTGRSDFTICKRKKETKNVSINLQYVSTILNKKNDASEQ